jgi:hypothetical protein
MNRRSVIAALLLLSSECAAADISRVPGCFGDVVKLSGDIKQGDYGRFRSHVNGERRLIGIELASDGGFLDDGLRIAQLARDRRLSAYVSGECDSACAFIFLSSRKRYMADGARIGVHSVGNRHGTEDSATIRDTLRLARLSAKLGVPPSTIGRMVTTPPGKISYLDRTDLAALKVILRDPFRRPPVAAGKPSGNTSQTPCGPDDGASVAIRSVPTDGIADAVARREMP